MTDAPSRPYPDTRALLQALMKIAHYSPSSTVQPVAIARETLVAAIGTWRQDSLEEISFGAPAQVPTVSVLESVYGALAQAQDCIRGETPEDISDEEAREDTLNKVREAMRALEAMTTLVDRASSVTLEKGAQ